MPGQETDQALENLPNLSECSLNKNLSWIKNRAPVFGINGNNVQVIQEPTEFYDILKEQARRAQKRIILASLYLGSGPLEEELVASIKDAIQKQGNANKKLQVEVLLDYARGSRGDINSRTMLLPLVREFSNQVQVSLFHSPDLRGMLKWLLPERWNEIVGLSHLKVYLFDDNLIMSGANLSDSYFTNRQDRYILIKDSPQLANFFHHLVREVSGLSFQLQNDNTLVLNSSVQSHPYENSDNGAEYREEARDRLERFLEPESTWKHEPKNGHESTSKQEANNEPASKSKHESNKESSTSKTEVDVSTPSKIDTWVFPLLQMAPFDIRTDEILTKSFFKTANEQSRILLGSGYFNLTDSFVDTIIRESSAKFDIITASPEANGFYKAAGVSGYIPDAYTSIAKQFLNQVDAQNQGERLSLFEYSRSGWTFHCKGLWHYLPDHSLPYLTIIGSSNFGYRSVFRDLEAQLVIATENEGLRRQLEQEQRHLYTRCARVNAQTYLSTSRRVPMWVPYITAIIRKFF